MECLNCNIIISQTPGKRPKLYCSSKCRIEYCRKKKTEGKPKRGRGRPKKTQQLPPNAVQIPSNEKGLPSFSGVKFEEIFPKSKPIKEVLKEGSDTIAKAGIEAAIAAIKAEKIPEHRNKSSLGRKSWESDQRKRIQELEKQLNEH